MNEERARKTPEQVVSAARQKSAYTHFTKNLAVENLNSSSEKVSLLPLGFSALNENGLEKQYYFAFLFDPHHSWPI